MTFDLKSLAASEGFPRVSIYFPTHRTYPENQQDPIRLAKALSHVSQQLAESGIAGREIEALTAEAAARDKDHLFWKYQDSGLAVFLESGTTRWLRLPSTVKELDVVSGRYHVRPLIRIFRDSGPYYVLAVSQSSARLFRGTAEGLLEIPVEDMPRGVSATRERTDFDADVGFHARGRGSQVGGAEAPKYAALGESPEDYKDVLLDHFCRDVAKAVDHHLAASRFPLVLAALPRTLGRVREHLSYDQVQGQTVETDPQSLTPQELHELVKAIVEPVLTRERSELLERLQAAHGGSGAPYARNLEDIIRSAEEGRIETLFLDSDAVVWGCYDPAHRIIRIDGSQGADNEDLLNLAALRTLAQDGDVRTLPSEFPGPTAALYRY